MKTTILDWLKEIPDAEVREKAIANYDPNFVPNEVANGISDAIDCMCDWFKTPEGHEYWNMQTFKYRQIMPCLTEELQKELDRHNSAILEILKKHGK